MMLSVVHNQKQLKSSLALKTSVWRTQVFETDVWS